MNDPKEIADKVMTGFYRSCLGKTPTFQDDKIAVAAALREVVYQLQYYNFGECGEDMIIDARAILDVCDELETLQ
jgi:hypothetical protein